MRIKALLTSILLASTTIAGVASASPRVRDHRDAERVAYRAPVRYQNPSPVQTHPSWMVDANVITSNVNYGFQIAASGTVQPYSYGNDPFVEGIARGEWRCLLDGTQIQSAGLLRVGLAAQPLRSIEIQATNGDTQITQLGIQYTDGRHVAVKVDRTIDASHSPNLRIDLGPDGLRGMNAIVVYGQSYGTFRVLGA